MNKQPRSCQIDTDKAAAELRRLREWIARARSQAVRVDLPDGPMALMPWWVMEGEPDD